MWNRRIFITGAGRGLGLALLKTALSKGAKVSAMVRHISDELAAIKSPNLHLYVGNVSSEPQVGNWISEGVERFSGLDLVINNAGAMFYMNIEKPSLAQMREMVETNCLGLINLIHHALPHLLKSEKPYWINLSSDAAKRAFPGLAVYSGSKAFVEFTANAMRQELISHNVKITNVQPGNIATTLHQKSTEAEAIKEFATNDHGQFLKTDDLTQTFDYLLSTPHHVAVNEVLIEPLTESI